jgi:hypothetical protein
VLLVATSVDELRVPTCRAVPWTALWFVEEEAPHGAPTVGRLVPWDIGQTASSGSRTDGTARQDRVSRPRVRCCVHLKLATSGDVGIPLSRDRRSVAKEILHALQIGTAFEEVCVALAWRSR